MALKVERKGDVLKLQFDSSLNVQNISAVYDELADVNFDKANLEIYFSEENIPDLSFLQLIVSLQKEILSSEQKIKLFGPLDDMHKTIILGLLKNIEFGK
ncbi:MAG: hypothetical protein PF489_16225 [Salinivirgaceae bacterium]|jgi:capsule polysaccharide export protein KpsE/RkpR|nr:hypothetical protein [Salinivirgaceae bacterium]